MKENLIFLVVAVALSSIRNIASKKTAASTNNKSQFFRFQTILFLFATLLLFSFGVKDFGSLTSVTLIYGILYGILLVLSQWMFTLALKSGNTSVCSVVYSLGFIIPTVSGALFWNEKLTYLNFFGVFVAIIIILLTAKKNESERRSANKSFVLFIIIAMSSSGGLGVMQKVQQSSDVANEKELFLFIAFSFAVFCSFIASLFHRGKEGFNAKNAFYPVITGICFGGANLCNTILAGKMKSVIFFPLQNVSTILFTTLLGIFVFKEKITLKTAAILILGIVVIMLFSI